MILVTGGSGFLGGHLVRRLSAEGKQVRALYNTSVPSSEQIALRGIEWMQCDLLDVFAVEGAMAGIEYVYHCSAIVSYKSEMRDEILHVNPESTANIVNQAVAQGIRKMVYASSVAAIGRPADNNVQISEDLDGAENEYSSAYAMSKYLAENEVWRGIGEGLSAVIINPSVILGAGDWSRGSAQLMSVVNNEFPFYTNGVSGWVGVADVVSAMVMLMEADVVSERFIVSGGNYPFREVFTLMANALNKKPPKYYAGPLLTGIVWRASALLSRITGKNYAITKESAKTAHSVSRYDNTKLLKQFPVFSYTPIKDVILEMATTFKQDND